VAHIKRTTQEAPIVIPTASMADVAFLMLIFFIVSTVFVRNRPQFLAQLPEAASMDPMKNRRNLAYLWVSPEGLIQIDSALVNLDGVAPTVLAKLQANPQTIVLIKSDYRTRYAVVSKVIEELRRANALRIAFATQSE